MPIEIKGLGELAKEMDALAKKVGDLDGQHQVQLGELLDDSFIAACSRFKSINEMFDESGLRIGSEDELNALPKDELDSFVRTNTTYSTWDEMMEAAMGEWVRKRISL